MKNILLILFCILLVSSILLLLGCFINANYMASEYGVRCYQVGFYDVENPVYFDNLQECNQFINNYNK